MIIEDTLVIGGIVSLCAAIAAMWAYYNSRVTKLEDRVAKVERDRLADYREHLERHTGLTERCVQAIENFTKSINDFKAQFNKG